MSPTDPDLPVAAGSVEDEVGNWRQGDCILDGHPPFVHWSDAGQGSDDVAGPVEPTQTEVLGLVVLTQSCDLVRPGSERPYLEVAPLVESEVEEFRKIERGHRPRFAFVPGLASRRLAADLDRVMTIEKALLAGWTRIEGCSTDSQRRQFAEALSRKRVRAAFPDDFVGLVSNLRDRIIEKHGKVSIEGRALRSLREIRVRAAPSWDADNIDILFWFIREDDADTFETKEWHELLEKWLARVPGFGRYTVVDGLVTTLSDMTAQEYLESDRLDLDHLSAPKPS